MMPPVTLSKKLGAMIVVLWIALILLGTFGAWQIRSSMIVERREQLRSVVEEAMSLVKHYYSLSRQDLLREKDAQKEALDVLSALRYGEDGYVSVNNSKSVLLMYPFKKELVGKDMSDFVDSAGNHLFVSAVNAGNRDGGGFVDYFWPTPGRNQPVAKVAYSLRFAPWDWYVVSGVYMDDVQHAFYINLVLWFAIAGVLSVIATCVMMLVLRSVRHTLGGDLEAAVAAAQRMASGNFTIRIPVVNCDKTSLLYALHTMQAGLVATVSRMRSSIENVNSGATEIAVGNVDLSRRTERQAAALVQTAAGMGQMIVIVKQNAESANQAARLAGSAVDAAMRGSLAVDDVISTMREITGRSQKIGDITGVIDAIAFQTNILALNAAVEAARAHEQGRGFAVVAAEVRSLAKRSAEAAKEIKVLIETSMRTVDAGAALVANAGITMEEIVRSVRRVSEILEEISHASSEQSAGIEQVNRAVGEMDKMSQHNAALVEQVVATSLSLKDQVDVLREVLANFLLPA